MSDQDETQATPEEQGQTPSQDPTPEEIAEWKTAYENAKLMQADYTRKTQSAAEMKREAEAQMKAAQALVDRLGTSQEEGPVVLKELEEYAPGLGKALGSLSSEVTELKQQFASQTEKADEMLAAEKAEMEMESAIAKVGNKPFANQIAIRSFLEENNLGPQHAEYAYQVTTAEKRAEQAAQAALKARNAAAPAPMKKGNVGVTGSTAQEVAPRTTKSISDKSFRDITREVLNDPRMPKS